MAEDLSENFETSRLSDLFEEGLKLHNSLDDFPHPSNSQEYQNEVKSIISKLEESTKMVNLIGVFSRNENIEEVATTDVKYLLLPALLGSLTLKLMSDERPEILKVAEVYFKDFLQRCKEYGITDVSVNKIDEEVDENSAPFVGRSREMDIEATNKKRQEKIERYKKQKEMEKRQEELKSLLEKRSDDEELAREYFLVLLERWINAALEELNSIEMEKSVLQHMAKMKSDASKSNKSKSETPQPRKPLKPIIITKNEIQKKVYGLGYPSIPTFTVDEFYEQRYPNHTDDEKAEVGMPGLPNMPPRSELPLTDKEREEEESERNVETDDPEALQKARNWDDWKDDHRRGWGNRKNMG